MTPDAKASPETSTNPGADPAPAPRPRAGGDRDAPRSRQTTSEEDAFVEVARLGDLEPEEPTRVVVDGTPLLLVRVGVEVFAVAATCTHETAPLDDGFVDDGAIECPRHGARFDLRSGAALSLPATRELARHEVRVRNDRVRVARRPKA